MPIFDPTIRMIQVRGAFDGHLLFLFNPITMEINIKKGGTTHTIKVHDLIAFAQTAQRVTFRAQLALETSEEEPVRGQFE